MPVPNRALEFKIPKTWRKEGRVPYFFRITDNRVFFIILRKDLPFTRKKGTLLKKVWKYGCLLRHNFYNSENFIKPIQSIKHVDVLYLLALILIFRSLFPFSFRVFLFCSRGLSNIAVGSPTTSRNELFHWFLKQYITGYNNAPIPE